MRHRPASDTVEQAKLYERQPNAAIDVSEEQARFIEFAKQLL